MVHPRLHAAVVMLTVGALISCEAPAGGTTPDVPVDFLQDRVQEVLDDIERARTTLTKEDTEASSRLQEATLELRRLNEYYLPLLAAREQVSVALGAVDARDNSASAAVDSAEAVLLGIVRGHGRHLEMEMRGPLERLEDVRAALAADDGAEAREVLVSIGHQLESIFFRGEIVLEGSDLDSR